MPPDQPNVVFILADDQRFDTIAALGNPDIHTPHLDRLVRSGTSFTQAHIMGGTHEAVCMPSRAMLLTGRLLFEIQDEGQSIPLDHCMLGEAFHAAGYQTFGTGKWHNGSENFNRCFETGDDIYFGGMADHWNVPANRYDPDGAYRQRIPICLDPATTNEVFWRQCDHVAAGTHSSELFADATIRFLRERDRQRPFLCYLPFMAPHDPRTMPEEFRALYDSEGLDLPPNFLDKHPFDNGELEVRDEMLESHPREPDAIRQHLAEYYAMISHLDAQVGKVLDTLESENLMENTLIVFAGDNGLALGQHGLMGKQNLYDHSVRVPLLFAGPGVPANACNQALCYLSDIFPTLCTLAGIPQPDSVTGLDLTPAFTDSDWNGRAELYLAYRDCQRALRHQSMKLIEYRTEKETHTQLFDLSSDPYELHDLSVSHAGTAHEMGERLLRARSHFGDTRLKEQPFWDRYQSTADAL